MAAEGHVHLRIEAFSDRRMLTGGVKPACVSRDRSRIKRFAAQMHSTKYPVPATASKAHSAATMIGMESMESAVQISRRRMGLGRK